jgi:hypothetical protein
MSAILCPVTPLPPWVKDLRKGQEVKRLRGGKAWVVSATRAGKVTLRFPGGGTTDVPDLAGLARNYEPV